MKEIVKKNGYNWYADKFIPAYWRDIQRKQYSEADCRELGIWDTLSEKDKEFIRLGDKNAQKPNEMLADFMKRC